MGFILKIVIDFWRYSRRTRIGWSLDTLQTILNLSTDDISNMRWRAQAWAVHRFSEEEFEIGCCQSE